MTYNKSILSKRVADQILSDEVNLGRIASNLHIQSGSLRQAIRRESQSLCLPHAVIVIKDVLGIPQDEDITELITCEEHLKE